MRVVIADDSGLLRDGLAGLLTEAGIDVVATVGDAEQLAAVVAEHAPDVAVVDIRMPPTFTHEGARRRSSCASGTPSSASCCCPSRWRAATSPTWPAPTRSGFGYLLKDRVVDVDVLVDALRHDPGRRHRARPRRWSRHLLGRNGLADAARPARPSASARCWS